jgi:hypothetical protein
MTKNHRLAAEEEVSKPGRPGSGKRSRSDRRRLSFDSLEERTMLSITIAALGDSLTDEYQFYAPYRTAAANWPEIISTLRPAQVDFGAFSASGAGRGQTRNQGYAQDWALQGMRSQGTDLVGYGATFANEYNGGYKGSNLPGLLTQPGGVSNINVVNILLGGNDYFGAILSAVQTGISLENLGTIIKNFEATNAGIIQALQTVVPLIEAANPDTHIIIDTVPSVADTPIVQTAAKALGPTYGPLLLGFINNEVANVDYKGSPSGGPFTYESIQQFAASNNLGYVDDNALLKSFIANPYFGGQYIDPTGAGPVYTDMFVGDNIHPGTIAQAILASAIINQIDTWYPDAITPLSTAQILQLANSVQPKTVESLTASPTGVRPGQQVTFKSFVPTFPPNHETSPTPPTMSGNIPYPAPTGTVTFVDRFNGRNQIIGTASLNPAGLATFATSGLSPGLHQITAGYSGNGVYPPAVSGTVSILVGAPAVEVQVLRFVEEQPQAVVQKISTRQLKTWLEWTRQGAKPAAVDRAIAKWVRLHTKSSSGATVAARSNAVAEQHTKPV